MKNRDFRLFDLANLPLMTEGLKNKILGEIGNKLFDDVNQKNKFKLELINRFGPKCAYCGCILNESSSEQVDHFLPADDNNRNDPNNLLLTCFSCNNSKRKNIFPQDFYPYQRIYSQKFKRNEYGFIVPTDSKDVNALFVAEKLHFSSIAKSISYVNLLIDYLLYLLEDKTDGKYASLLASLAVFKRKLDNCAKILCLQERL